MLLHCDFPNFYNFINHGSHENVVFPRLNVLYRLLQSPGRMSCINILYFAWSAFGPPLGSHMIYYFYHICIEFMCALQGLWASCLFYGSAHFKNCDWRIFKNVEMVAILNLFFKICNFDLSMLCKFILWFGFQQIVYFVFLCIYFNLSLLQNWGNGGHFEFKS